MRIDSHQHFWIYNKKSHQWIDDSMKKIRKNFLPSQLKLELKKNEIDLIRLITPTTDEKRLKLILKNASGFLYYVSVMGITGQKSADLNELEKSVIFIKKHTNLPVVPGFGIKNSTDVNNICKICLLYTSDAADD